MRKQFPDNFLWGSATAAFQIEGHPEEYAQKLSDWSHWIDREDKVLRPTNNGNAVKHWDHYQEDIQLMKEMGATTYRFSFNWAATHRAPGEFDEKTLEFYDNLLAELEQANIKPFATLVHFVLPEWLAEKGSWENPETAYEFQKFTQILVERYSGKIQNWITHNEPNIYLWFGYESGIWPPGYENAWDKYLQAYQGLLLGHQLAYKTIKEHDPKAQVGFAQNLYAFQTADFAKHSTTSSSTLYDQINNKYQNSDIVPTVIRNQLHNLMFIDACAQMDCLDFLGINYYTRFSYQFDTQAKDSANTKMQSKIWGQLQDLKKIKPNEIQVNNLNWELYADGLLQVLTDKRLLQITGDIPIYITENGYCHIEKEAQDLEDQYRVDFIKKHLGAVHKAIESGTNVQGYFYWSFLDNFEWALGMDPRFGLIHVDHKTFKRTPKASYKYYSEICKNNELL